MCGGCVYLIFQMDATVKYLILDFDWTLVKPLRGNTFPQNVSDWQWFRPSVLPTLRAYVQDGFTLVIWSNQTKSWKEDMIRDVCRQFPARPYVVISRTKSDYKPNTDYFWRELQKSLPGAGPDTMDIVHSRFIGDALGRPGDHSACDALAAGALGISFMAPEDVFCAPEVPVGECIYPFTRSDVPEVVILCGLPGAGKSTFATWLKDSTQTDSVSVYSIISGDACRSSIPKMVRAASLVLHHGVAPSVIFDATNVTRAKREMFIAFARERSMRVRCVWIDIPVGLAIDRTIIRAQNGSKLVPKIAIYTLNKKFEPPQEEEGFQLIHIAIGENK